MPVEFVEALVRMGNDVQRLLFHTFQHATFTTAYWTKVNPMPMRKLLESIEITDELCFGLGALASCQGFERLHAWLKLMFRLLTHGREGSRAGYLLARFMFQIAGEQGDFDVPSGYRPDRRHRFAGEGDGLDPLTGQSSTSKQNKKVNHSSLTLGHSSKRPALVANGGPTQSQPWQCTRTTHHISNIFDSAVAQICEPCTMLATFIRPVCLHGKTPTGAFGDYLSREESKVALARTKERIDENFEDGLVASYEAQSPDNPSGVVAERDMSADGDEITPTTTTTATPPIATTTTTDATMTAGAAEESVLDGIAEACGFDLDF